MERTNLWVLNIPEDRWDQCVAGPDNESIHGKTNVNQPCFDSKSGGLQLGDLTQGDIMLPRVPGRGTGGVWEFHKLHMGKREPSMPWGDGEYITILYCRPLHREFDEFLKEDFFSNTEFGALSSSVSNVPAELKSRYLRYLLNAIDLEPSALSRLENELELE